MLKRVDDVRLNKETIIIGALRLFLVRGYKSVSLVDVAKDLGITKGGIYHYFSSKDELLQDALHFFLESFETKYRDLLNNASSLRDLLQALLVEDIIESNAKKLLGLDTTYGIDHIHFAIEIMRLFPDVQNRIWRNQALFNDMMTAKFKQAIEKGEIRGDVDSDALSAVFVGLLNGQKSMRSEFRTKETRQRMLDSIWKLIQN